ncbi:DNA replication and repair protein RecN [Ulvibacter sp. MAR_2010_11]|uniref:DNA repair protein RecN n=1 Tax=Ulvibacter sp. MAR_2010_11 TaxID=1250229 RepID=UPI000C2BFA42|nr:DNA repair protein RecN [Ulvibacter sp. MAR_2010_11]PKA81892.1 DNA replication and repair protein RecN [Ulvibacter sp. MAR_2010_11]
MITTLSIKNYALIDDIRVDFNKGLTIITGETGAGKSILLGALALVLGKRADLSSVKNSSKKCIIEAEFALDGYNLQSVFDENDLDYESHTIIRREILPNGKSRAFVNDTPVMLQQLQALGPHLVDIHSQHETLTLSSETFQLEVIDALANTSEELQKYSQKLEQYKALSEELSALKNTQENATKELDYNTFLYNELKEIELEKINQQELEETYETLSNTEEIQESLSKIVQLLSEEQIGSLTTLKEARIALGKLRPFSSEFESLWNRLNSVVIELEDILETAEDSAATIEADPEKLTLINEKLQALYKLQHKHTVGSVDELKVIETDLEQKIEMTLHLEGRIKTTAEALAVCKMATSQLGQAIHVKRKEAIPVLKEKLESFLSELGLPNARFKFELTSAENFRKNGTDSLELLFTANKGLPFGLLKKVASGGELSRIMLAVKAVLTKYKKLPTIIFDEIDTGVSGEIAHKMATILSGMSQSMQLFSITHLPQIAAKGEHHIKVYKEDQDAITVTRLKTLDEEERILEIAQMIGGIKVTDSALAHAKELLN